MEPTVSTEVEGETKERKKIHFVMPASAPTNLDPRQVEMIRRRRPTPATLFRVSDQTLPEDDQGTHQWVVGENGVLKPKRVNPHVYQPPSLKAVQKMAEVHMQHLGVYPPMEDPCEGEEYDHHWHTEEGEELPPAMATDHPETATVDQSEEVCSTTETAKKTQLEKEEEEEEEEEDEEVEEEERNRRGSN